MTCVQRDEGGVQARERERVHAAGGRGEAWGETEKSMPQNARVGEWGWDEGQFSHGSRALPP